LKKSGMGTKFLINPFKNVLSTVTFSPKF